MSKQTLISRRTALKGLGTAISLPFLEGMAPTLCLAGAATAKAAPKRMAFFYIPNGVHMANWTPAAEGPLVLTPTLEPLAKVKDELLVLSGLTQDKARANGDGPGDHARAMATFLTGRQAKKTSGADIRIGVSVDQAAAQKIGTQTKFPSLELGCDRGQNAGNCDSGYSCAYSNNLSWKSEATPLAKEINPRAVFERLFGNQSSEETHSNRAKRERYQISILDFVAEDATQLRNRLGSNDQRKLDEYMTAIREIEVRVNKASPPLKVGDTTVTRPVGVPATYEEHIRLLCDMLALSFQTDVTRIATMVLANDGSNRSYRFLGVSDGHHDLSHHGGNKEKQEKIAKINKFHISQLAYFLERLKGIQEGEKSLLDSCMIVYGSGISDGNRHNHDDLPILLAGNGGGTIRSGRHIRYKFNTPLCDLYVGMLDRVGVHVDSFGDSRGILPQLS